MQLVLRTGGWFRAALLLGAGLLALLAVTAILLPGEISVREARAGGQVLFTAERGWVVAPGGCATLRWAAEGIAAVHLDGAGVAGAGERAWCASAGDVPALRVTFQDGTAHTYRLPVRIALLRAEVWLILGAAAALAWLALRLPQGRAALGDALLIGAAGVVAAALALAANPVRVEWSDGGTQAYLAAERALYPGATFRLWWAVDGVQAVYLNEEGVPGAGEAERYDTPVLALTLPGGGRQIVTLVQYTEHVWLALLAFGLILAAAALRPIPGLSRLSRWLLTPPLHVESAQGARSGGLRRAVETAAVAILPALAAVLLVALVLRQPMGNFLPTHSDELYYWRQAYTFSAVGFQGGYYTYNELAAPLRAVHFGAWGPLYPIVYGSLGRLFGWRGDSAPLFNMGLVAAAVITLIALVRPDRRRLLALALVLVTFWPLLLYLPSNMQESFQQATGIVLAGLFYVQIAEPERMTRRLWWLAFLALVFASLIKYTSAMLFLPFFLFSFRRRDARAVFLSLAGAGGMVAAGFVLNYVWSAPYPMFITSAFTRSLGEGLETIRANVLENLGLFFQPGHPLFLQQRLLILALLGGSVIVGGVALAALRRSATAASRGALGDEALFHLWNLATILMSNILFYNLYDDRDYRLLAGRLIISLVLLAVCGRFRVTALAVASSVAAAVLFVNTFSTFLDHGYSPYSREALPQFVAVTEGVFDYQPDADPWCNTLLAASPGIGYLRDYIGLPPGIGLSVAFEPIAPRSRYVLLNAEAAGWDWGDALHLEPLRTFWIGTLYLNRDAPCP